MQDRVKIVCHYSTVTADTIEQIMHAVTNGLPFILMAERSAVLFDIKSLTAYWIGKHQASFSYEDILAFRDGISLQLLSHQKFIDPKNPGIQLPEWLRLPPSFLLPE